MCRPIAITLRIEEQDLLYGQCQENEESPAKSLLDTAQMVLGSELHNGINLHFSIRFMQLCPLFDFLPLFPLVLY